MSEADAVLRTTGSPATVGSLAGELRALGVERGMRLLVHSSLSALGWVCGGAQAVVLALQQALGDEGTLVMPAHSSQLSNPAAWEAPPVPQEWWETIRRELPAYDPRLTPTRGMGAVVECFRHAPGAVRSGHPQFSFVACGPDAAALAGEHPLSPGLGLDSPLGALYRLDGHVLLLGVGHERNTSLHLAEHLARYPGKRQIAQSAPLEVEGQRVWRTYQDLETDSSDFAAAGAAFGGGRRGTVGRAGSQLFRQRELVDFGVGWFEAHRG